MELIKEVDLVGNVEIAPVQLDLNSLSKTLDIVDVRILKQFYYPEPTPLVFKFLYQKFLKYRWKKEMLRCRVRRLAQMGLIIIVPKTKPMCILPVKEHESQLKLLTMAMLGMYDLKK
jgi:hypothetical protein